MREVFLIFTHELGGIQYKKDHLMLFVIEFWIEMEKKMPNRKEGDQPCLRLRRRPLNNFTREIVEM